MSILRSPVRGAAKCDGPPRVGHKCALGTLEALFAAVCVCMSERGALHGIGSNARLVPALRTCLFTAEQGYVDVNLNPLSSLPSFGTTPLRVQEESPASFPAAVSPRCLLRQFAHRA